MKNFILTTLFAALLSTFLCAGYLREYYTTHMPETPQIQEGRTFPIDVFSGKMVYVTLGEKRKLEALVIAFVNGV
jgi:hypothetical protein